MNKEFWQGKKICITGGASFIASHTIEKLLELGPDWIYIADDFSSGKHENIPDNNKVFKGMWDLRSYEAAKLATEHADIVLDFSSVHGGRGFVGTNHDVAISDNLIINTNVLRAAVENGVERIAFSSSGCVYDVRMQMDEKILLYIDENWIDDKPYTYMLSAPDGMYGMTKLVHEKVLGAYHRDGKIKTAICRFFTVFGPRMRESHFILASIAKSFIRTDPFYVWGTGTEVRNFTPVQNIVQGFLLATEQANGEAYNIGLEEKITIDNALDLIWDLMKWRPKEIIHQPDKPVGIRNRVSDCTKARTELDWKPEVTFEQCLQETIDWYVSTHNVDDVKANLERQLTER